jgi:hypothetical protein
MKYLLILLVVLNGCGPTAYVVQGATGPAGPTGPSGASCTTAPLDASAAYPTGGAVIVCGETQVVIANGVNGMDAITSVIDPCGKQAAYDEVLLQLSNGLLLASFSDNASGKNTRFSVIGNGNYVTTDGTGCRFTVNNNNVTW